MGSRNDVNCTHQNSPIASFSENNALRSMEELAAESKGPVSSFQSYSAEADILAKLGSYKSAAESYTKALQLPGRAGDKNCLVFRSKCYLLMGDALSALNDANESLAEDKDFFKGIFQKAEALYATGDFETALVYYHRGNKLRPEFADFRLGIQKASEAIDNSIGNPRDYKFRPPAATSVLSTNKNTDSNGSSNGRAQPPSSSNAPLASQSTKSKQLLGDLYIDRIYLEDFLHDKDFVSNSNENVSKLVKHALTYLDTRAEFWCQQKPIYARVTAARATLLKAHSARNRRIARDKAKEKVALENGVINPTIQQVQNANIEQKLVSAGLKSAYMAFERRDFAACIGATEGILLRLGDIQDQRQQSFAMAECYSLLGKTHLEIGDLVIALEYAHIPSKKRAYVNLAKAYVVLKRFKEAIRMFRERLELVVKTSSKDEVLQTQEHIERAWILHDIARCHIELGQLDVALEIAEQSAVEADISRNKAWILNSKILSAQLQAGLGQKTRAHASLIQAFTVAKDVYDIARQNFIITEIERIESSTDFIGEQKVASSFRTAAASIVLPKSKFGSQNVKVKAVTSASSNEMADLLPLITNSRSTKAI